MQISSADLLMYIQSISREKELPYEQVLDIFGEALAQSLHITKPISASELTPKAAIPRPFVVGVLSAKKTCWKIRTVN